jgi:hypothetical protein
MPSSVELLVLDQVVDHRGQLAFIEEGKGCPFAIEQVIWGAEKGSGIGREEIILALAGEIEVHVKCPEGGSTMYLLKGPHQGIYLAPSVRHRFNVTAEGAFTVRILGAA